MTPIRPGFVAFRGPVEREVFAPGFALWLRVSTALDRIWRAAANLPDRGRDATPDDVPPEYFRFPPF